MGCGCKSKPSIPSNISYRGQAVGATAKQAFLRLLLQNPTLPLEIIQVETERLTGKRPVDIMQAIRYLTEDENAR